MSRPRQGFQQAGGLDLGLMKGVLPRALGGLPTTLGAYRRRSASRRNPSTSADNSRRLAETFRRTPTTLGSCRDLSAPRRRLSGTAETFRHLADNSRRLADNSRESPRPFGASPTTLRSPPKPFGVTPKGGDVVAKGLCDTYIGMPRARHGPHGRLSGSMPRFFNTAGPCDRSEAPPLPARCSVQEIKYAGRRIMAVRL
jgi:hypothetical protein